MTAPVAAFVSFRFGADDGVSVQAATWMRAAERLGFTVRRVAGELTGDPWDGDVVIPGLAVAPADAPGTHGQLRPGLDPPEEGELAAALAGAALVVVENVLSLPLNLAAAEGLTGVLAARLAAGTVRVVLHHHDFAWQRDNCKHLPQDALPPVLPGARHVTINDYSRAQLAERGFDAVTVHNGFDLDAPPGRRDRTRAALGVAAGDVLVLQPTRAVPHKNIPAALELCRALARHWPDRSVNYWLPGPAEDGYSAELADLVARAGVPVLRQHPSQLHLGPGLETSGPAAPGLETSGPAAPGLETSGPAAPGLETSGPAAPGLETEGPGTMADAYAACDLVTFPSLGGEGFGQPVIEAVWARRPLAVAAYAVLDEIVAFGFTFASVFDPGAVARAVDDPDADVHDKNLALAREHFSLDALTRRLGALLDGA